MCPEGQRELFSFNKATVIYIYIYIYIYMKKRKREKIEIDRQIDCGKILLTEFIFCFPMLITLYMEKYIADILVT